MEEEFHMESPVNQTIPGAKPATGEKRAISVEAFVFLGVFILIFGLLSSRMGLVNTMMNTAFDLLINTVLYIMGIAVLAGALGAMLTEFGVVALINKLLSQFRWTPPRVTHTGRPSGATRAY